MTIFCPASMCPLVAPTGSPWTGEKNAPCPEHSNLDHGGCPWFTIACSTGGIRHQVDEAFKAGGRAMVLGPNQPRRHEIGEPRTYDCARAGDCSWQKHAKGELCPPRYALSLGLDPRVCLF